MKKIRQLFAGRRKNPCIFAVLFVLCLAAELFLSNWRDFSIGDAPETVLPAEALTRADGAELLDDGTIRVNGAGAELEFTGLSVNARTITIHTSAPEGTVSIASCFLTDDASQYDYKQACLLYFHPAGGHCFSRGPLISNGNLHGILLSFDRLRGAFTIDQIVLNERRGFYFDKLRFCLLLLFACFVWACRSRTLRTLFYDPSSRKHRLVLTAGVALCLAVVCWIYGALASFGSADPISYPLEEPVASYGAYVQQFDAFQKGHLFLDLETDPRLNTLHNVYDYSERIHSSDTADWKQPYWDRAFYNGHYYSYFGIGPILTVYYPYYLLTGALPGDAFVSMIYSALCAVLLLAVLEELRKKFLPRVHLFLYVFGYITLFFASLFPLVMVSSNFYYIAVNGAMAFALLFFLLFFHAFSMKQGIPRRLCAAAAGIAFVLLVLCRPNAAIAVMCAAAPTALLYLAEKDTVWKYKLLDLTAFIIPVAIGGALICAYNMARFGTPTEFGTSYQLTVSDITYNTLRADPSRLLAFVYYDFLEPPDVSLIFPFISLHKEVVSTLGNYIYHTYNMGLFCIPLFLCLFLFSHPSIEQKQLSKRLTYLFLLLGSLLVAFLDFSLGGIFIRYLCDITLPLGILALLLALEYEARLEEDRFGRPILLCIFVCSIFIGSMLIFGNENCMLLNSAPEQYLRIMDLFRL